MQAEVISVVTTPASSYDLASLSDVKDELGVKDNSSNALLQRYLTSASAAVAQYCNRVFPAETMTETFWASRDRGWRKVLPSVQDLQLSRWPVQSVTSVTENGNALVEDIDFKVNAENGQLVRLNTNGYPRMWPVYPIVVVYTGGFATIPADVEDAVIRMVTKRYVSKGRDPSLKQESIPGVREVQYWIATGADSGNMTPDITDILDNYRTPAIA
ncbi:phage head-tail connector protein [Bradyrhizobium elkanii]|uniref:phage head-tail connector protein n=1 Tax=Bradyrhizobium elkanii TaxID=29448 RepID=UPI00216A77D7|nr:phage head-tail connector protein [Bradyrhizobium elkanii]MCS3690943.1 hypothetical protein [Bradyrhizobium elkanii]